MASLRELPKLLPALAPASARPIPLSSANLRIMLDASLNPFLVDSVKLSRTAFSALRIPRLNLSMEDKESFVARFISGTILANSVRIDSEACLLLRETRLLRLVISFTPERRELT